jgi:hypothetical protein
MQCAASTSQPIADDPAVSPRGMNEHTDRAGLDLPDIVRVERQTPHTVPSSSNLLN